MSCQRSLHRDPCLDLSIGPSAGRLERVLRANVATLLGKKVQHSFGAVCGPSSKENVIGSLQRASSVNGNESSVSHEVLFWWPNAMHHACRLASEVSENNHRWEARSIVRH
jgi:hypothetical protein